MGQPKITRCIGYSPETEQIGPLTYLASPRRYSKLETSANFPAFLPACLLLAAGRTVACVPAGGIHWLARLYFFLFPTAGPSSWPNSRRKRQAKNRTVEPRCPPPHRKSAPQNAPRDAQSALEQMVRGFVGGGMGFEHWGYVRTGSRPCQFLSLNRHLHRRRLPLALRAENIPPPVVVHTLAAVPCSAPSNPT